MFSDTSSSSPGGCYASWHDGWPLRRVFQEIKAETEIALGPALEITLCFFPIFYPLEPAAGPAQKQGRGNEKNSQDLATILNLSDTQSHFCKIKCVYLCVSLRIESDV